MATATQIISNGAVAVIAGPSTAISDSHWSTGATLAELSSLTNYSAGVQAAGSTFNVQASNSVEDRSWADQAGAKSRGLAKASGTVEPFVPGKGDTSSIIANAYDAFTATRTPLAFVQRFVTPESNAIAAGDEVNIFKVMTDGREHKKTDASQTTSVDLILQDGALLNYIVPASTPTSVSVTPSGALAVTLGAPKFLKATYEGRNVTVGAQWVSSNEAIFKVTAGGIIIPVAAGTANLTVSIAGSAAGSSIAVTVS